MKLSLLKKAVEDVLIRPPDLDDNKQAPKAPEADDGTTKAEKPKSEVNANSPEDGVTEKGATWEQLDDASKAYLVGFVGACKEASVDPTLFVSADLVKHAIDPMLIARLMGALQSGGSRAMGALRTGGQKVMGGLRAAGAAAKPHVPALAAGGAGGALAGAAVTGSGAPPAVAQPKV